MDHMNQKLQRAFDFFDKGFIKQAEIFYLECLDKIDDRQSAQYKQALHGLGYVKSELKNFTEASELYTELLRIAKQEEDKQDEAIAYHQLGMVQRMEGNYEKARHFFAKEQAIYHVSYPDFHLGFAANLYEYGMLHLLQGNLQQAQKYMEDSLRHAEQTDDRIVVGCAYRGLGDIVQESGEQNQAMYYFQHALDAFTKAHNKSAVKEIKNRIEKLQKESK